MQQKCGTATTLGNMFLQEDTFQAVTTGNISQTGFCLTLARENLIIVVGFEFIDQRSKEGER